jgi:DNA gyrase subunit A
MLISNGGTLVRTPVTGIPVTGRNTQGVRLISLSDDAQLVGIESFVDLNGNDGDDMDEEPSE